MHFALVSVETYKRKSNRRRCAVIKRNWKLKKQSTYLGTFISLELLLAVSIRHVNILGVWLAFFFAFADTIQKNKCSYEKIEAPLYTSYLTPANL